MLFFLILLATSHAFQFRHAFHFQFRHASVNTWRNEPTRIDNEYLETVLVKYENLTTFRIENAQSASPSSFISARKAGDLNEKRCKKKEVEVKPEKPVEPIITWAS